ncbi:ABC transporter substrate-binding protein [Thalassospira sp. MA62]|nr:ABC transporter substrate-binding protein [Thalassospira sp. MA62]
MKKFACAVVGISLAAASPAFAAGTTLNVGMASSDVGQLDPHVATSTPDVGLLNWMFNGLVRITPGKTSPEFIEPDIAKSWTSSEDGLTWTFDLRDDVTCHGKYGNLDAQDVVYSLRRAADPNQSSFANDYLPFQKIEATGPYQVTIKLENKVPSLLGLLVPYHGGNIVCQDAVEEMGDAYQNAPVGTGPFMFAEYQPQQYVKLVANPDYFRGAPQLKEIYYRFIQSDASRDLAFQSGEIDMMYGKQDQTWLDRIAQLPDTTTSAMLPGEMATIHLNMESAPLDNILVRKAIAHAIDRDAIVNFKGARVTLPATSPVPEGYLGYSDDVPTYEYSIEKAKELLAEAGYEDGLTLKAIVTTLPSMMDTMLAVQAQLAKVGITLEIEPVEHATFHQQIRQDLSQVIIYVAARFPVADTYLTQFYYSPSSVGLPTAVANFSHCYAADQAIETARLLDGEDQMDQWKLAQQQIMEDVCSVPIYQRPQLWAWSSNLDLGVDVEGSLSLSPPVTEKAHFTN